MIISIKKYYDTISKFKEKPKDRVSLKGQSFLKIYNKAFDVSCNKCFEQIREKAHQFLIENFLDDIQEQTPRLKTFGKTVEENLVNIAKHCN